MTIVAGTSAGQRAVGAQHSPASTAASFVTLENNDVDAGRELSRRRGDLRAAGLETAGQVLDAVMHHQVVTRPP